MELVDLYDEDRLPLGRTAERYGEHLPGEHRLVVHVCLFDRSGRLLIQQRSRRSGSGRSGGTSSERRCGGGRD